MLVYSQPLYSTGMHCKPSLPYTHTHTHARTHTHTHTHTLPPSLPPCTLADTPSGAEMHELLTSLEKSNGETKELLDFWRNFLNASLETAKKFDNDHGDLSDWLREKEELLSNADTVRGVPEGVEEQILQVEVRTIIFIIIIFVFWKCQLYIIQTASPNAMFVWIYNP